MTRTGGLRTGTPHNDGDPGIVWRKLVSNFLDVRAPFPISTGGSVNFSAVSHLVFVQFPTAQLQILISETRIQQHW